MNSMTYNLNHFFYFPQFYGYRVWRQNSNLYIKKHRLQTRSHEVYNREDAFPRKHKKL